MTPNIFNREIIIFLLSIRIETWGKDYGENSIF